MNIDFFIIFEYILFSNYFFTKNEKTIFLLCLCLMGYLANADVKIMNNTSCTYVLSIPVYGYLIVPPGSSQIIWSDLITDIKVAYWPGYPSGPVVDQVFVQLFTIPFGTSLYPSCAGSNYNCKYTPLSFPDTLLEIF